MTDIDLGHGYITLIKTNTISALLGLTLLWQKKTDNNSANQKKKKIKRTKIVKRVQSSYYV